jgi:hypothetical protein
VFRLEKNRNETKQLCHTILERLRSNKASDKQVRFVARVVLCCADMNM